MLNPIAIFNGGNYSKTRVNREQSCIVTDIYEKDNGITTGWIVRKW